MIASAQARASSTRAVRRTTTRARRATSADARSTDGSKTRHRREQQHDHHRGDRARPQVEPPQQRTEERERERDVLARHREQVRQAGVAVRGHDIVGNRTGIAEQESGQQRAGRRRERCGAPQHDVAQSRFASRASRHRRARAEHLHAVEAPDRMAPRARPSNRVGWSGPSRPLSTTPVAGFEHAEPERIVAGGDHEEGAVTAAGRHPHVRVGVEPAALRIVDEHARERHGRLARDRRAQRGVL